MSSLATLPDDVKIYVLKPMLEKNDIDLFLQAFDKTVYWWQYSPDLVNWSAERDI
jgi:hypothetical protein